MKRNNVKSSSINSIGYDKQNKILEIEFKRGIIYQYLNFTNEDYEKLINASLHESIGKYFFKNISNKYEYIKVN